MFTHNFPPLSAGLLRSITKHNKSWFATN